MAKPMNDEERAQILKDYNPKDHLIPVGKDRQGKITLYYPAAWRLYELHLRYANANFKDEILYQDEKGTVIVKAYLYLGKSYEESEKKAEAMKQGTIGILDKVETAAKARAARDFGIGTEYALDMEPDETDATHDDPPQNERKAAPPSPSSPPSPSAEAKVTPAVPLAPPPAPEPEKQATSQQLTQISALCEVTGVYEWKHLLTLAKLPESIEKWTERQAKAFIASTDGWTGSPLQKEWAAKTASKEQIDAVMAFCRKEQYGTTAVLALRDRLPDTKGVESRSFTNAMVDHLLAYLVGAKETVERARKSDPQFAIAKSLGVTHPLDFYHPASPLDNGLADYLAKLDESEKAQVAA